MRKAWVDGKLQQLAALQRSTLQRQARTAESEFTALCDEEAAANPEKWSDPNDGLDFLESLWTWPGLAVCERCGQPESTTGWCNACGILHTHPLLALLIYTPDLSMSAKEEETELDMWARREESDRLRGSHQFACARHAQLARLGTQFALRDECFAFWSEWRALSASERVRFSGGGDP